MENNTLVRKFCKTFKMVIPITFSIYWRNSITIAVVCCF